MKSKILGRTITITPRDAATAYNIICWFVRNGLATLEDEKYYAGRAEFVIGDCCDSTFHIICSDIMAEGIELL